jgi:hypothetical protein
MYETHQFPGKYMLVKVVLYLFIGYINTQLFKGITWKILKSKNIQQAYYVQFIPEKNIHVYRHILTMQEIILFLV